MAYATNLTDAQWAVLEPIVTDRSEQDRYNGGRPRTADLRRVVDALLYQARTGVQWRLLPCEFPPSGTVRYYFDKGTWDSTWIAINDRVRDEVRSVHGRAAEPTAASIDSQTVKTTEVGGERGYDGGKKLAGRKRHILVDTKGNLLTVVVHRANIPDRDGAYFVLEDVAQNYPRLQKIWADQGYTEELVPALQQHGITLDIVAKLADQRGFVVLPRRWVVERTVAWLGRFRRLSKDYEQRVEYSETWVYVASIARMLRTLHPNQNEERPYKRKKSASVEEVIMPVYA